MWTQRLGNARRRGQLLWTSVTQVIIRDKRGAYRKGSTSCQLANGVGGGKLKPARSQLESLATCTVPVNLNPPLLLSRHTPTRRSMQRSRILNLNMAGRRRPMMRYYRFLVFLTAIQLVVGVSLTAISIYASTVSPSLRIRDLPHWAGIPLFLSGFMGIAYVMRCYGDLRINTVSDIFKAVSCSLAAISIVLCTCAVTFHAFHLITFYHFEGCVDVPYPAESDASAAISQAPLAFSKSSSIDDEGQLVENFDTRTALDQDQDRDRDRDRDPDPDDLGDEFQSKSVSCTCYRDAGAGLRRRYLYERIACDDVTSRVRFLFVGMAILGCLGAVDCGAYVVLLWILRYKDIYVGPKGPSVDRETHSTPSAIDS